MAAGVHSRLVRQDIAPTLVSMLRRVFAGLSHARVVAAFGSTCTSACVAAMLMCFAGPALAGSPTSAAASADASPASAQAPLTIQLVNQDATTPLGGTLRLRLRITGSIGAFGDLEVRVVAHPSIDTLEALTRTAAGDDLGGVKDAVELPLADLARFANGDVVASVALQPLGEDFDFTKLNDIRAGVYPIEILVRDADEDELARTISWLVAVAPDSAPTVQFAWIWTLAAPPDVEDDGVTPTESFITSTHDGGPLAQFVDAVGATDLPLSLAISPQTMDAWSRAADRDPDSATTFERAQSEFSDRRIELLPVPYVPVDGPGLEAAELGSRVPDSFLDGAQTLQSVLGRRPNPATVFADPIDAPSLDRLGETFAYQAIVRSDAVAPAPPTGMFSLRGNDRSFAAIATRPDLEAILAEPGVADSSLERPHLPGARVQRWFTALALLAGDRDAPLPVVLASDAAGDIDSQLLQAMEVALADQDVVEPVRTSDLFTGTSGGDTRDLATTGTATNSINALEVLGAQRSMQSFVSFVGDDHPAVLALQANLRLVVARSLPTAAKRARLGLLDQSVATFVAGIGTESKRVTLTDRRSSIPLSFRNDTEREVEVRVTLASPKLVFPGEHGATQTITLPPGRNTQAFFDVEARASGKFTMQVIITSSDGNLAVGAPTQITVTSAVFGSIGTWLTYGAVAFLALWWAHHLWRSRRRVRAT
jgi:hypothetical protein